MRDKMSLRRMRNHLRPKANKSKQATSRPQGTQRDQCHTPATDIPRTNSVDAWNRDTNFLQSKEVVVSRIHHALTGADPILKKYAPYCADPANPVLRDSRRHLSTFEEVDALQSDIDHLKSKLVSHKAGRLKKEITALKAQLAVTQASGSSKPV